MPLDAFLRIETFDHLPSTQAEMRDRLERGEAVHGLVIRAARQSRGRGQRGRAWVSEGGGSYQTLALRDTRPPRLGRPTSSVAVALGIAETFAANGLKAGVKWPNDLFYRGRKLGGILTEYRRSHLLVGVGVNVSNEPPEGAAALTGWDLPAVHAAVLEGIQRGIDAWLDDEASLPARFARCDALAGRSVRVRTAGRVLEGRAAGIDADGCLLLDTGRGRAIVRSGSVSLPPTAPAAARTTPPG